MRLFLKKNFWPAFFILAFPFFVFAEELPNPTPTPLIEPPLSEVINKQVDDLRQNLFLLNELKAKKSVSEKERNEAALRQSALFKVIDISLNENNQLLSVFANIENINSAVAIDLKKVIEADNKWYRNFISKVNLTANTEALKKLAGEIKAHREEVRGVSIRRLAGMLLVLQEIKSIEVARTRSEKIWESLNHIESTVKPLLGSQLVKADQEIENAYQLTRSSQLRLENMSSMEDFQYARDWLERANDNLKNAYKIFGDISEKAK